MALLGALMAINQLQMGYKFFTTDPGLHLRALVQPRHELMIPDISKIDIEPPFSRTIPMTKTQEETEKQKQRSRKSGDLPAAPPGHRTKYDPITNEYTFLPVGQQSAEPTEKYPGKPADLTDQEWEWITKGTPEQEAQAWHTYLTEGLGLSEDQYADLVSKWRPLSPGDPRYEDVSRDIAKALEEQERKSKPWYQPLITGITEQGQKALTAGLYGAGSILPYALLALIIYSAVMGTAKGVVGDIKSLL